MRKSTKEFTVGAVVLCVLIGGGLFAYQQIFTKGVDRLPTKVCDGAIKRQTVSRVLPGTRSAEEGAEKLGAGEDFLLNCHIYTSGDSILSGEAQVENASARSWIDFYRGKVDGPAIRVSADGVQALALTGGDHATASVYVACVPRGVRAHTSDSYALITEARVIGESRAHGLELRQAVTDFAYQLTVQAYKVGECQKPRTFPAELPRYKTG